MGAPRAARDESSSLPDGAAFLAVWIPYTWLASRLWFVCDDAFISFRYAKNWAEGNGLRFNPGEHVPVEGYSNFLWVAVATLAELSGLGPAVWLPRLSFVIGSVLLYGVFRALRGRLGLSQPAAMLATLSLGCSAPFATWSSSGLETMAFAALFFLAIERMVLRAGGAAPVAGGLAALGLATIRAEGIAWALGVGVLAAAFQPWSRESLRRALVYFSILIGGFGAYWLARFNYFGNALPNTVYAKVGFSGEMVATGLDYLTTFVLAFLSPILLLIALPAGLRRSVFRVGAPLAGTTLAIYAYGVLIGGDFMTMGRVFVPALAFQTLIVGLLLSATVRRRMLHATTMLVVAAFAVCGSLPAWDVHVVPETVRSRFHFRGNSERFRSERAQLNLMRNNVGRWRMLALTLNRHFSPGATAVRGPIGVVGYYTGFFLYDTPGLVTPSVATREGWSSDRSPGHMKRVDPSFFMDQRPDCMSSRVLLYAEDGASTEVARQKASNHSAKWRKDEKLKRSYAPRIVPIEGGEEGFTGYVFFVQRFDDERAARAAWKEFRETMDEL